MSRSSEGFIICMLKDAEFKNQNEYNSFVLSYYDHLNICRVTRFENYRVLATRLATSFIGERKQLLLYRLAENNKHYLLFNGASDENPITIRNAIQDGRPFGDQNGFFPPAKDSNLMCISVLKINPTIKKILRKKYDSEMENQISHNVYSTLGSSEGLDYECFGTLGGEDICVIFISNSFDEISRAVNKLRTVKIILNENFQTNLFEKSYSTLILGPQGGAQHKIGWGNARAEIFISTKGNTLRQPEAIADDFCGYMQNIKDCLHIERVDECVGEYDYVFRCPADRIDCELYTDGGILSHDNTNYKTFIDQSNTIITAPAAIDVPEASPVVLHIGEDDPADCDEWSASDYTEYEGKAQELMYNTIKNVRKYFGMDVLEQDDDNSHKHQYLAYVEQALSLLNKDYMRIIGSSFHAEWRTMLWEQYSSVLKSILFYAEYVSTSETSEQYNSYKSQFEENFELLIKYLHQSFNDIGQIDNYYYEKLNSNLHNSGAYTKILRTYYELINEIIELTHAMPREDGIKQDKIVPIVILGITPKIKSDMFYISVSETYSERLVVFTLSYQSLSRIPRYIGPLFHEVFHYFIPSSYKQWNYYYTKSICTFLFRLYLSEYSKFLQENAPANSYSTAGMFDNIYDNIDNSSAFQSAIDKISELILSNAYYNEDSNTVLEPNELKPDHFANIVRSHFFTPLHLQPDASGNWTVYALFVSNLMNNLKNFADSGFYAAFQTVFNLWSSDHENVPKNLPDNEYGLLSFCEDTHRQLWANSDCQDKLNKCFRLFSTVWQEVFPDLYDICLLIPENEENSRINRLVQYLWQIYNVRCDTVAVSQKEDVTFDNQDIRIGIVTDILWIGNGDYDKLSSADELRIFLEKNLSRLRDSNFKEAMINQSVEGYARYLNWIQPHQNIARIIKQLAFSQIEMMEDSQRGAITGLGVIRSFFKEYYTVFFNDESQQDKRIFTLCLNIIGKFSYPLFSGAVPACGTTLAPWQPSASLPSGEDDFPGKRIDYYKTAVSAGYVVDDPVGMFDALQRIYEQSTCLNRRNLWFRGESDASRIMLPSLMRSSDTLDEPLSDVERRIVRYAKSKIYSFVNTSDFDDADWMGLLQHYGIPSPILDWSEDFPTALFFATERWLNGEKQEKDAVIYILDPVLMNIAGELVRTADMNTENELLEKISMLTTGNTSQEIPLFSEASDAAKYWEHIILDPGNKARRHADIAGKYPVAGRIRMNNDRMVAQSGTFVFYNLQETDKHRRAEYYKDFSVAKLQEDYIEKMIGKLQIRRPPLFLQKIILSRRHWERFKTFTQRIGMSRASVYPELNQIKDDVNRVCATGCGTC